MIGFIEAGNILLKRKALIDYIKVNKCFSLSELEDTVNITGQTMNLYFKKNIINKISCRSV